MNTPPPWRPEPTPPPDKIKREPVRTSFDRVFPGMPPAVKLSA